MIARHFLSDKFPADLRTATKPKVKKPLNVRHPQLVTLTALQPQHFWHSAILSWSFMTFPAQSVLSDAESLGYSCSNAQSSEGANRAKVQIDEKVKKIKSLGFSCTNKQDDDF